MAIILRFFRPPTENIIVRLFSFFPLSFAFTKHCGADGTGRSIFKVRRKSGAHAEQKVEHLKGCEKQNRNQLYNQFRK